MYVYVCMYIYMYMYVYKYVCVYICIPGFKFINCNMYILVFYGTL